MKSKICSKCKTKKHLSQFDTYYDKRYPSIIIRYHSYCKQCRCKYNQIYVKNNTMKIKNLKKRYNKEHKSKNAQRWQRYYKKNKLKIKKYKQIKRKELDYKLINNLRCRLWFALKKNVKSQHTINLLGCSISELKKHLQNQFTVGMTWNNYGKWHIDHIKPCCKFDLSKISEQKKCFNYTNLQPLWAKENLEKNNKYGRIK